MNLFGIGAIFCNESHILKEWIETHYHFGCRRFFLVNNNSTDNYMDILQPYIQKKLVTLYTFSEKHKQEFINNEIILKNARGKVKWLAILDLDEFLYPPNPNPKYKKITDILAKREYNVGGIGGIVCPWVFFGSSGHIKQPPKVIDNFTYRDSYDNPNRINVKTIYNLQYTKKIIVHNGEFLPNYYSVESNSKYSPRKPNNSVFIELKEEDLQNHAYDLVINHYAIQSWDFFRNVKMTRGDVHSLNSDNIRNKEYFESYDKNEVLDECLKNKI